MRQKVEILLSGAWRGENQELVFYGYSFRFAKYKWVLELDGGNGYTIMSVLNTTELCT